MSSISIASELALLGFDEPRRAEIALLAEGQPQLHGTHAARVSCVRRGELLLADGLTARRAVLAGRWRGDA